MGQRYSEYTRADHDFYCEPGYCVDGLLSYGPPLLHYTLHDPAGGLGVVINVAAYRGYVVTGADVCDRAQGRFPVLDFFADDRMHINIVTNPPFKLAARIIKHGLQHVVSGGRVCVLVPLTFLASAKRYGLFASGELDTVLILSRRPSMPPGQLLLREGESCRHSGSIDFCWVIWHRDRSRAPVRGEWVPP
jgi:hypothetical protein